MMIVMDSLTLTGADSSPVGAVIRVTVAFVVFFATLVAIGLVLARVPTPDVLVNLPDQIATLCGVAAVVFVSARAFDVSPAAYGLEMNRRWISDLLGGTAIGVLFQAVTTAAIVGTGTGTVVDRWSMGVFDGPATLVVALGAPVLAFFIIALWEDLLFRGVLIREFVVGLASRGVSRVGATGSAVVVSTLLFGALHENAGAVGLSTAVVVLQAVGGGLYFGLDYVLTDGLALPIGIHFSTNLWTTIVFGQLDSGFSAAFRLTRSIDLGAELIIVLFLPVGILFTAVFA
jgi:membrane protease YdiL (CAAX protease family)